MFQQKGFSSKAPVHTDYIKAGIYTSLQVYVRISNKNCLLTFTFTVNSSPF